MPITRSRKKEVRAVLCSPEKTYLALLCDLQTYINVMRRRKIQNYDGFVSLNEPSNIKIIPSVIAGASLVTAAVEMYCQMQNMHQE